MINEAAAPVVNTTVEIKLDAVESSQIEAIGHDEQTKTLAIRFKGGAVYRYSNVEKELFEAVKTAASVGGYFSRYIKPFADKFPYVKIKA